MGEAKDFANQARAHRRGLRERERRNHFLFLKNTGQYKGRVKKETVRKEIKGKSPGLVMRIRIFVFKMKVLLCRIGWHDPKLMSGKEGTPKFLCVRCMRPSKAVWKKEDFKD